MKGSLVEELHRTLLERSNRVVGTIYHDDLISRASDLIYYLQRKYHRCLPMVRIEAFTNRTNGEKGAGASGCYGKSDTSMYLKCWSSECPRDQTSRLSLHTSARRMNVLKDMATTLVTSVR